MERKLVGKQPTFRPKKSLNIYRVALWLALILAGIGVLLGIQRQQIEPLFQPTPTPTRTAYSYIQEAQASSLLGSTCRARW
jgi:hypothetical protein